MRTIRSCHTLGGYSCKEASSYHTENNIESCTIADNTDNKIATVEIFYAECTISLTKTEKRGGDFEIVIKSGKFSRTATDCAFAHPDAGPVID